MVDASAWRSALAWGGAMSKTGLGLAMAALACWAAASAAGAQTAADFYHGKTLYMVVGSDTGGGNDLYNKLIAKHIGKYIPGNPNVVAQNMPGANGLAVINYVADIAPKDGTILGATQQSSPFEPLFGGSGSKGKFDALRLNWIGSPNRFASVAFSWHASPVKTAADLLTQELIVGESDAPTIANDGYLADNLLGYRFHVVFGYASGSAVDLAISRGEIQGRAAAGWQGLNERSHDWLANHEINFLYQIGQEKYPGIPADVPLILDLAKSPQDRAILDLKYAAYSLGYPNFVAAEVPAERVAILRSAFASVLEDPQFRDEARQARIDVDPVSAEKITAVLQKAYAATPEMIARLAKLSEPPPDAK
jgi:tripartite-type tricarboxylate transporter receptor subunit TctC